MIRITYCCVNPGLTYVISRFFISRSYATPNWRPPGWAAAERRAAAALSCDSQYCGCVVLFGSNTHSYEELFTWVRQFFAATQAAWDKCRRTLGFGQQGARRKDGGLWAGAVQCHVYDDQVV